MTLSISLFIKHLDFLWVACGVCCWSVCGGGCCRHLIQSPSRIIFPLLDCSAYLRLQSYSPNLSGFLLTRTCLFVWRCQHLFLVSFLYFIYNPCSLYKEKTADQIKCAMMTGDCRKFSHDRKVSCYSSDGGLSTSVGALYLLCSPGVYICIFTHWRYAMSIVPF